MKLFLTGATGFLGRVVTQAYLEAGHDVRALVRAASRNMPRGVETVQVGFDDAEALRRALEGRDAIVHLAGKVSRDPEDAPDMHRIHVNATRKLIDAAKEAGVRKFLLASTSGTIAVSENGPRPATEHDTPKFEIIGRWPYYTSKLFQEQEVLRRNEQDDIDAVILNPSLLLGPGDERMSSTTDVLNVLNRRVSAVPDGTVAFVDVRDCAAPFVRALTDGRRGHRYLLNGANMSVRTFVDRIATAGDISAPKLKVSKKWAMRGAKVLDGLYRAMDWTPPVDPVSVEIGSFHWACDASKARTELGFSARDPQETINATVRFFEEKGLFRRV